MSTAAKSTDSSVAAATAALDEGIDPGVVERIVERIGRHEGAVIPILQAVQAHFRYLPRQALVRVCEITEITPARITGVATFYSQFRHMPVGKHLISVCHGTACHVAGAEAISDALHRHLGIEGGADTDAARLFTVQKVACLGCCSLAPVMRIDGRVFGHLAPDAVPQTIERFLADETSQKRRIRRRPCVREERVAARSPTVEIWVGQGTCCMASGSLAVRETIEDNIRKLGLNAVVKCGNCGGMCHRDPIVEFVGLQDGSMRYGNVTPATVPRILRNHVPPNAVLRKAQGLFVRARDLLAKDSAWQSTDRYAIDASSEAVRAFMSKQKRIVLAPYGQMDPVDIEDYFACGGYEALERCVKAMRPQDVIQTVKASRLRGRGGAGFPTGLKWKSVRQQPGRKKYVVMNGDEGDPGAFMDRMLLESYPHRILEGMAIAAFAIGVDEGYLYIREEYPLAVQRVREAIRQAEERGFLGERIFGTDFSLRLHIMEGAGAFVCGEETGLIASIEGRRGMPRFRPPYPAQSGLWGRPTNINNAETYAGVPWIIRHGPEAYAAIGTESGNGTKVFALAGRIVRGGLIEVPLGITIGEIVEDIGGGIRDGRKFKAVQVGGPSGGCIPASMRDTRIDYEELIRCGAMMGSGGLVVMDDTACMVDIARYFLQFTQNESCGKCTFCRIGTKRMLEVLDRLYGGDGGRGDIERLEELALHVKRASLCGLGRTAPNPVLTTLRYFRDEYEAHIDGRCPAKRCRALITYSVTEECIGCTLCAQHCPVDAIEGRPYEEHEIDTEKCFRCGTCKTVCPVDAVEVK